MKPAVLLFALALASCATASEEDASLRTKDTGVRDSTTTGDDSSPLFGDATEGDTTKPTDSSVVDTAVDPCPGKTLCSGSCVSLDTDVNHCGSSDKKCEGTATSDATCSAKTCSTTCKSGFVSLSGSCTSFGGAYEAHTSSCGTCANGNVFAGGACACPTGFSASGDFRARTDACGVLHAATLGFCDSGGVPAGVWGGAFQRDDAVSGGVGCRAANAKTSDCTCPSGWSEVDLRVLIVPDGGTKIGSVIGVCVHPSVALDNFGGVYQVDDAVSGGLGCRAANPRTGDCSCPAGATPQSLRTLVDTSKGEIGAQAVFCTK